MIGIVGAGVVGKATGKAFEWKLAAPVMYYDVDPAALSDVKHGTTDLDTIVRASEVLFLCLPTPTDATGRGHFAMVADTAAAIMARARELAVGRRTLVQKSTCVPGTAEAIVTRLRDAGHREHVDFDYLVNPEFLDQANALQDALQPSRIVLGTSGDHGIPPEVTALWKPFDCPLFTGSRTGAELAKYASNYAMALLISFWNELFLFSQRLERVDTEWIADTVAADPRLMCIRRIHGMAYGGACLPKDTRALLRHGHDLGAWLPVLEATVAVNDHMAEHYGVRRESWTNLSGSWRDRVGTRSQDLPYDNRESG